MRPLHFTPPSQLTFDNIITRSLWVTITAIGLCLTACDDYDDSALWEAINGLTERVEALEQWQDETNNNIAAIQELLTTNDMITSVTPVLMGEDTVGYTISFLNSDPVTLYNGEKGEAGDTPQIGLTQDEAGDWYWTLNGELMKDADGNPIRANGEDGKDGEDGADGDDGATGPAGPQGKPGTSAPIPQIKLGKDVTGTIADDSAKDDDAWYLSVDGGTTWYRVNGQDGTSGDSFFTQAPVVNEEKGTVTFYLSENVSFEVPLHIDYTIEGDTYTVYTAEGLLAWGAAARNATTSINCTLAADIDMTGESWTAVFPSNAQHYIGTFDGNGHTIRNLSNALINDLGDKGGTVKNLVLDNPTVTTINWSGAITGSNYGTIENCHVIGGSIKTTTDYGFAGGIAGTNDGTIQACSSSATVSGTWNSNSGGITGSNSSLLIACYATGAVSVSSGQAGAIAGLAYSDAIFTACYWSGTAECAYWLQYGYPITHEKETGNKVEDETTWATAAEEMNKQLTDTGYQWVENTDPDTKDSHPLIVEGTPL